MEAEAPVDVGVRRLRAAAAALFQARQYELASETPEQLRQIDDDPLVLYNLGRCHEDLGHTGPAIRMFEAYLERETEAERAARARDRLDALGVILFEALTGRVPFDGPTSFSVLA